MNIKNLSENFCRDGITDRLFIAVKEIQERDTVLEIGVGRGELVRGIQNYRKINLYGADINESALHRIESHLRDYQVVDVSNENLKFQENQFDVVICLEVFEHLQNPQHALMEIQRVLKPGGKLVLSIPNYLGGHLVLYPGFITPKFFRLFLRQNYFKIKNFFLWGPVWNKDNIGVWFKQKLGECLPAQLLLVFVQINLRILQMLTRMIHVKIVSLYWCYFFICENRKDKMDKSLVSRQWEQTLDFKERNGWYHPYYHAKI